MALRKEIGIETIHLYKGKTFRGFSEERIQNIDSKIRAESASYILILNEDDFTEYLVGNYCLAIPSIDTKSKYVDSEEKDVPVSLFPRYGFCFDESTKFIKKQVVKYQMPFNGDINLLKLQPNPLIHHFPVIQVDYGENTVLIEIINFYDDPKQIEAEFERVSRNIFKHNYDKLIGSCNVFNHSLKGVIKSNVQARKQELLKGSNLLAALGVRIKKRDGVAETFRM